jgi:hypothetical protein
MPVFDVALWRQNLSSVPTHNALIEASSPFVALEWLMQYTQLSYVEYAAVLLHVERRAVPMAGPPRFYRARRVSVTLDPYGRLAAIPFLRETRCCRRCACGCLRCNRSCLPYVEKPASKGQLLPVCLVRGRHVVAVGDMVVYRSTFGGATHPREKGPYRGQVTEIDEMGLWVRDEDGAGLSFLVLAADVLMVERAQDQRAG